jgi:hypothetical protein
LIHPSGSQNGALIGAVLVFRSIVTAFSPERPADIVGNIRPAYPDIMQLALAHRSQLPARPSSIAP